MTKKTAFIAGASGLTGNELLHQLLQHPAYDKVIVLVRRELDLQHPKLQQTIGDFEHLDPAVIRGDDFFCALGTTLAKAGSKEAQFIIDCAYPIELGRIAKDNGFKQFLLVSSVGADPNSSNFYLKTKGQLEATINTLGFDLFVAARPSFLLGNRPEFRFGERIGILLSYLISPLLFGALRKYRGIRSADVAKALIHYANNQEHGVITAEYDALIIK